MRGWDSLQDRLPGLSFCRIDMAHGGHQIHKLAKLLSLGSRECAALGKELLCRLLPGENLSPVKL